MRCLILIFALLTITSSCKEKNSVSDTREEITNKKEIYEILNFCLSLENPSESKETGNLPDKLTTLPYQDNPSAIPAIIKVFPEDEAENIRKQINDTAAFRLEARRISGKVRLISYDTLTAYAKEAEHKRAHGLFWKRYDENFKGKLLTVSKPIVSANGTIAVVSVGYSDGPMSGFGWLYVVTRTPKGWKILRTLNTWIS